MVGATDMVGGDQNRPLKDNRDVQVQSCTQRGVDPRKLKNTRHIGRRARRTKIQGSRRISRHDQPGDNQASTAGSTIAGDTAIPIRERWRELPRHENLRQQRAHIKKGKAKPKGKKRRHSRRPTYPSTFQSSPPPSRRKITTLHRARSQTNRGRDEKGKEEKSHKPKILRNVWGEWPHTWPSKQHAPRQKQVQQ